MGDYVTDATDVTGVTGSIEAYCNSSNGCNGNGKVEKRKAECLPVTAVTSVTPVTDEPSPEVLNIVRPLVTQGLTPEQISQRIHSSLPYVIYVCRYLEKGGGV